MKQGSHIQPDNLSTRFHIHSLDGVRGLAALIVFAAHAGTPYIPGGFGVTIFFFLSGYLITTLLRREFEATGVISLRNFYLRRLYRIFPPLYLVLILLLMLVVTGLVPRDLYLPGIIAQFAQFTNYAVIALDGEDSAQLLPYSNIMWSLSVEEHFYVIFPALLMLLVKQQAYRRIAGFLLLGCAAVLLWRCALIFGGYADANYTYHATDTRIDSIIFGCIMAVWWNPVLDERPRMISDRYWMAILGIASVLLLASFILRSEAFRETFRYSLQGIALFPVFYCAVRFHHWPIFSWLDSRPARFMGTISYTFYLSHFAFLRLVSNWLSANTFVVGMLAFVCTFGFATASYFLIERRFARLRQGLHDAARRPANIAAVQPIGQRDAIVSPSGSRFNSTEVEPSIIDRQP